MRAAQLSWSCLRSWLPSIARLSRFAEPLRISATPHRSSVDPTSMPKPPNKRIACCRGFGKAKRRRRCLRFGTGCWLHLLRFGSHLFFLAISISAAAKSRTSAQATSSLREFSGGIMWSGKKPCVSRSVAETPRLRASLWPERSYQTAAAFLEQSRLLEAVWRAAVG